MNISELCAASPRMDSSRQILEARLMGMRAAAQTLGKRPAEGWVRFLRTALGMSANALAQRLEIRHSTVIAHEKAELNGRIRMDTLARLADALEADLVVALVPRRSVRETLQTQAIEVASHETFAAGGHPVGAEFDRVVDSMITRPKRLWR